MRRIFIFIIAFWGIWIQNIIVSAETEIVITAESQWEYATFCFEAGDYATAEAEYKRFIYFFPKDVRCKTADFNIGMCFFHEKSYDAALSHFTRILNQEGAREKGIDSAFMVSTCYQRLGNLTSAINNLIYLRRLAPDSDLKNKIDYRLGWLYLESAEFIKAQKIFSEISVMQQNDFTIDMLNAQLAAWPDIKKKSPVAAGILSIFPGGGYLYCHRYRDALTAFLINGILIYGAYESFDNELYAIGGIMTALETGFYAGSIYGGISSAYKYNAAKQTEFIVELKKQFPADLSLHFHPGNVVLGMSLRF